MKNVFFFQVIPHVLLAVAYVFLHSMLVLLQATTLNVAINASNKALLTIMMSNNFVELKGSVFKKFDRSNLFQVPSTQLIIVRWLMIYLCPMFNQGSCTGVLFRCEGTVPPLRPPFCSCSTNNERVRKTKKLKISHFAFQGMVGERIAFGLLRQTACLFLVLKFSSTGLNMPSSQGEIV